MDTTLLEILACPKCRGKLTTDAQPTAGLHCAACSVVYPVENDIPVLLVEEAITQTDWDAGKRKATAD